MDEELDDMQEEDVDEQIEQMIMENGMLVHTLATLLVRKGIIKQEEIDTEMDKLYDEVEGFGNGR
ncbi:MAG TPA: hypothetical protein VMS12_10725, partial [Thermoanaerobaculia bacterium]|nr:hypothetical protein [Thermoanaerobaculia bacterium]